MKNLGQEVYEDDNGRPFEAAKVDVLAPYTHICDGFYKWTCGRCGVEHSDRWWSISGRVVKCETGSEGCAGGSNVTGCGAMNLLVRTNTKEVTEALTGKWRSVEMEQENERFKGVVKFNHEQLTQLRHDLIRVMEATLTDEIRKLETKKAE